MGRVPTPASEDGLDAEYRTARLCRRAAVLLGMPATDDAALLHRRAAALKRANRAAAGLDLAARADVLVDACRAELGDERVERLRRAVADEPLPPDPRRRAQYVAASERGAMS